MEESTRKKKYFRGERIEKSLFCLKCLSKCFSIFVMSESEGERTIAHKEHISNGNSTLETGKNAMGRAVLRVTNDRELAGYELNTGESNHMYLWRNQFKLESTGHFEFFRVCIFLSFHK